MATGASPRGPSRRSPLLTLRLLEPPGEVVDAHVFELEQVLQAPHLHLQNLGSATQRSSPDAGLPQSLLLLAPGPRTLPARSHLHGLLRGQQLLLPFCDLEDEAWIAVRHLVIPRRPERRQPAFPGVGSSLAEA